MANIDEAAEVEALAHKLEAALAPLAEQHATRSRAASKNHAALERVKPIIMAARAKGHGWRSISEAIKTAGIFVSRNSLSRYFAGQEGGTVRKRSTSSSSGSAKKKAVASVKAQVPAHNAAAPTVKSSANETAPKVTPSAVIPRSTSTPAHAGARRSEV